MKNFNKKKNWEYISIVLSSLLILTIIFQNCEDKNGDSNLSQNPGASSTGSITFKIKHEGTQIISDILWQVRTHRYNKRYDIGCYTGSYEETDFREADLNVEVDWNDVLQTDNTLGVHVFVQAFIQLEEEDCITYKKESFQLVPFDSNKTDLICAQAAVLSPHISPNFSTSETSSNMIESLNTPLYHFTVGDSIDLELVNLRNIEEDSNFIWSIKNIEDDIELADQNYQDTTFTYIFLEKGVYNISAIEKETNFEISTQLLIGKCEDTDNSEEIIMETQFPKSN